MDDPQVSGHGDDRLMVRKHLAEYLREQARWRGEKAREYPGDTRNLLSAEHLQRLAEHVERLPDDDPKLQALDAVQKPYDVDVYLPGENAQYLLSRFGFHYEVTDLDGFLDALITAEVGDDIDFQWEELG